MHLLLTDRITCPRCGPDFGLILLAHEVRDRRVIRGDFGCSNCRETYPVEDGFGDLRSPPRRELELVSPLEPGPVTSTFLKADDGALRMAALLGVTEGPGTLLLAGPAARRAPELVRLIGEVEVVAVHASLRTEEGGDGVSRMVSHPGLPFFSDTFRGVLLSGEVDRRWMAEGGRVTAPNCRLVVLDAPGEAREWLEGEGMGIVLEEDGVVVAQREDSQRVPLVTLRGS